MSDVIEVLRPSPHVAEIWLNRPDVRNAFNDAVVAGLTRVFAQLAGEPELRVVLLAARGKAFCAGADLNWMRAMADYSWDENRQDAQRLADMLWTLDQCPVPVVGRIQGDCYAGGMGLAGVCDVLVASSTATFCLSAAGLAAGDHQSLRGTGPGRTGIASLLCHGRALYRRAGPQPWTGA
jgi:methylglutaconyl-CoA hydratase